MNSNQMKDVLTLRILIDRMNKRSLSMEYLHFSVKWHRGFHSDIFFSWIRSNCSTGLKQRRTRVWIKDFLLEGLYYHFVFCRCFSCKRWHDQLLFQPSSHFQRNSRRRNPWLFSYCYYRIHYLSIWKKDTSEFCKDRKDVNIFWFYIAPPGGQLKDTTACKKIDVSVFEMECQKHKRGRTVSEKKKANARFIMIIVVTVIKLSWWQFLKWAKQSSWSG